MTTSKLHTTAIALAVLALCATEVYAGSVEYLTNQSADYIRTFSRNASTDGVDAAVFNPAGTVFLRDGFQIGLSSQTLLGEYSITGQGGIKYPSDVMVPVLPSLHAVYKTGKLAFFGAVTVPSGGGSLNYKTGIPYLEPLCLYADQTKVECSKGDHNFTDGEFAGSSIFLGGTVGVAYALLDTVALSVSGRVVTATKKYDGKVTYGSTTAELHAEKKALGVGAIIGLHARPIPMLDIALRYELETPMEFETTSPPDKQKNLLPQNTWGGKPLESFADGAKEERPIPAVLGAGLAVHLAKGITVSASYHYYFTKQADKTDDYKALVGGYTKGYDDDYKNGFDLGFSVEYQLSPKLLVSLGYIRAVSGGNSETYSDFEYALDSNSVGGGFRYGLNNNLQLTLGVSRTFFEEAKNEPSALKGNYAVAASDETFNKRVLDIALGAQYSF